jgi:aminodeoxychorismate synthase component I
MARPLATSREIDLRLEPRTLCAALREHHPVSLLLDGSGGFPRPWSTGTLVAVTPRARFDRFVEPGAGADELLATIDRLVRERRGRCDSAGTGVVLLLAHETFQSGGPVVVLEVDRSVRFPDGGRPLLSVREAGEATGVGELLDRLTASPTTDKPARCHGRVRTSLPREAYLRAVQRIRELIAAGEIYQANLCQRFSIDYTGDEFELYRAVVRSNPAPLSAFVQSSRCALVSNSPESFLRIDNTDRITTFPIKGTRPRGATPDEDAAARRELLDSAKDRAELLMIVDLERNDLGRVCRTGTVRAPQLAQLESFPTLHHLVACVEGRLRSDADLSAVLRAAFPGGSITGAPKIRAMQVLAELEPVRRSFFTGSLFWFGDDGTTDSSILIRTLEMRQGHAWLGAGGGIVTDSDPEQEWLESNHKAAVLAAALGFSPEEAR